MIRVHSFDRHAGVRPSMAGMGRHNHNFSFSSFHGKLAHYAMPAYALNFDDHDDCRVSRDLLVRLPSAYNYCFPGFSGGTITQLALSS